MWLDSATAKRSTGHGRRQAPRGGSTTDEGDARPSFLAIIHISPMRGEEQQHRAVCPDNATLTMFIGPGGCNLPGPAVTGWVKYTRFPIGGGTVQYWTDCLSCSANKEEEGTAKQSDAREPFVPRRAETR
jgi:hypothetical protein